MTITPEQCRMARAGLHMSQADLARRADVAPATIAEFEKGEGSTSMTARCATSNAFSKRRGQIL